MELIVADIKLSEGDDGEDLVRDVADLIRAHVKLLELLQVSKAGRESLDSEGVGTYVQHLELGELTDGERKRAHAVSVEIQA